VNGSLTVGQLRTSLKRAQTRRATRGGKGALGDALGRGAEPHAPTTMSEQSAETRKT
jgi:hypothetical protein